MMISPLLLTDLKNSEKKAKNCRLKTLPAVAFVKYSNIFHFPAHIFIGIINQNSFGATILA